jgi:GNAT superfamily N-acetyltransferase
MIRPLSVTELPLLEACAREFYGASRFLETFDMNRFRAIWEALLGSGNAVIFIDDRDGEIAGTLGGLVHPDIYGGELVAEEFFWFVRESHRGRGIRLYREFERWARDKGAVSIQMVHLLDVMPQKVSQFYLCEGFQPVETRYAKSL